MVTEAKKSVDEKRVKPTVIRRRQKKAEIVPEETVQQAVAEGAASRTPPAAKGAAVQPGPVAKQETPAVPKAPSQADASAQVVTTERGIQLIKPSEQERKIGVVGYIDLGAAQPAAIKAKEDWRERMRRGRRRKNKAELEMEAIQRAGGLKQYADIFGVESLDEGHAAGDAGVVSDRVFRPGPARKRKAVKKDFKKTKITKRKAIKKVIRMEEGIRVSDLSQFIGVKAGDIIKKLMDMGVVAAVNQAVDVDTATLVAGEYGFTVEHTAFKEEDILVVPEASVSSGELPLRPPVVTVMGHVDHGKTSILDVIRKANVAEGEAGGITQHIGAYEVATPKGRITFLDTPGHEAFTMMRARGAEVTDIVVLVIAADDGIMPQTVEAIDHAKAAGVSIIIAINKIDKPDAQPERVKQALTEYGLVPEDWGGDVICVKTSARTKEGIEHLLEMILLQAEMQELRADPKVRPKGFVVEARLDKSRGAVATVLVQEGTLKVGDYIVCGVSEGRVRAMFDAEGKDVLEAGVSKPVEILGLGGVPSAGDEMVGVQDDEAARLVSEQRLMKERERALAKPVRVTLEDLAAQLKGSETKKLGVIVKTDVHGSMEAINEALVKLSTDKVRLNVLHSGVGGITESDVILASASKAVILGFNVRPDAQARVAAEREGVDVRTYRVIYELLDEVKKAMEGLLAPELREVYLGSADVKEVFKVSKVGSVAGCKVSAGKIQRSAMARLLRDQAVVFEGKISSLKRFKDDAKEVTEGYECGIGLENFNDVKAGDVIEAFIIEKKAATL